jgi:Bacterial Ig-like domain
MTFCKRLGALLVVSAALGAAGCSGFGSNCSTDADCQAQNPAAFCDPTLKVCFLAAGPVVTNIAPANGASNVTSANAQVVATFSEPIVDAGVTFETFTVIGQGFTAFSEFVANSASTEVTWLPIGGSLSLGTDYTVHLTADIKDGAGKALTPFTSTFSTQDGAWQSGGVLRYTNSTYTCALATNYFGNIATVVELFIPDSSYNNDYGLAGGVSAAGEFPTTDQTPNIQNLVGEQAFAPSAGMAIDLTAFAAWTNFLTDAGAPLPYTPMVSVADPTSGIWSAPLQLDDAGSVPQLTRVVGLNGGTGFAVWLHTTSSATPKRVVFARYYDAANGGWLSPGGLQTDTSVGASNVSIAGNLVGSALVAWQSEQATSDGGPPQIIAASAPGATFPTPVVLSDTTLPSEFPFVGLGVYGTGAVVWQTGTPQTDGGITFHIFGSTFDPSQASSFAAPVQLDSATTTSAQFAQVGVAANGNAVAVWQQFDSTANSVASSTYNSATHSWSAPVLLDSDPSQGVYGPAVVVDPGGNALASWFKGTELTHQIMAGRYTADAGWHGVMQISTGPDTVENLQLLMVVDGFGRGYAVDTRLSTTAEYIEFIPFQ